VVLSELQSLLLGRVGDQNLKRNKMRLQKGGRRKWRRVEKKTATEMCVSQRKYGRRISHRKREKDELILHLERIRGREEKRGWQGRNA